MAEAYIVDAVRTPTGKRRGGLSDVHGADLGAHVLKAIVERNSIPDVEYDDVIFGCLDTLNEKQATIFRMKTIDGMDTETICNDFDITPSNLWVIIHRARKAMADCLESNWF